jgi:hypothetical protein
MALGNGGSFRTLEPSLHARTQLELLKLFIGAETRAVEESAGVWRIDVQGRLA